MGDEITMAAGFYALAYKWGDQTVISNRGTDSFDLSNRANDVLNGWLAGIGKKRRKSTWRWRSRLSPPPA